LLLVILQRLCHPLRQKVTLNNKEQKRVIVLNRVLERQMTGQEAGDVVAINSFDGPLLKRSIVAGRATINGFQAAPFIGQFQGQNITC
jgi:hypothetical protein